MLIRNSKAFMRGLLLMASFIVVFCLFFMEIFPGHGDKDKVTGLVFADHLFNTLSKGSSNYFDPSATNEDSVQFRIKGMKESQIDVDVPFKPEQNALRDLAQSLATQAGLEATPSEEGLLVKGSLYGLLQAMTEDSFSMYGNDAAAVAQRHGVQDGKSVMKAWWQLGTNMIKPLQKIQQVNEASAVNVVVTKGIEPSYNFYGIEPLRVADNVPLVAGFLIFYVVYTMWYGFAIFELFEGIGLTMKKTIKSEV